MDFDFAQITAPFRMHAGLSRLDGQHRHLTPLARAGDLYRAKQIVSDRGLALHHAARFDATDALASIDAQLRHCAIATDGGTPLELRVEQDLAVLDADTGTVPWMCVCVPSGWAPEDKVGGTLAQIHAPVADNQLLAGSWQHLAKLLTQGGHWQRHVWTISPSPQHDQHPRRRASVRWPQTDDPEQFVRACYLRAERQTFFPVAGADDGRLRNQAVFTIRVMVAPLLAAVRDADQARRLLDALASMSDAVLHYKGLAQARAPLCAWLARQSGATAGHAA